MNERCRPLVIRRKRFEMRPHPGLRQPALASPIATTVAVAEPIYRTNPPVPRNGGRRIFNPHRCRDL